MNFQTQMEHLRFPGLFQWGHLRHAFQSLFLSLGRFGGSEKDRKFVCGGFRGFTQALVCLWTDPTHRQFSVAPRNASFDTLRPPWCLLVSLSPVGCSGTSYPLRTLRWFSRCTRRSPEVWRTRLHPPGFFSSGGPATPADVRLPQPG